MDYKDHQARLTNDHFWFRGKEHLISVLMEKLPQLPDAKILNVGAGTGNDVRVIRHFGQVWAIDLNPDAIDLIPAGYVTEKKVGSVYDMAYPTDFFDTVVAFDMLEHLEDDAKAIREILRVLKPGGYFVFTVPACPFLFGPHDIAYEHYRRYTKPMIKDLLDQYASVTLGYWLFSLFLPATAARLLDKYTSRRTTTTNNMPALLNTLFYRLLVMENTLIKYGIKTPIGLSLYGIYRAPHEIS